MESQPLPAATTDNPYYTVEEQSPQALPMYTPQMSEKPVPASTPVITVSSTKPKAINC